MADDQHPGVRVSAAAEEAPAVAESQPGRAPDAVDPSSPDAKAPVLKRPRRYERIRKLITEPPEEWLLKELGSSGLAVFPPGGDEQSRTVRADVIYGLLLGLRDEEDWRLESPRLYLENAVITGEFDLSGLRRQHSGAEQLPSLTLVGCRFERDVSFAEAAFEGLELWDCTIPSLSARGLRVAGGLDIYDCVIPGGVDLRQCRIDGDAGFGLRSETADGEPGQPARPHRISCAFDNGVIEGDLVIYAGDCRYSLSLTGLKVRGDIDASVTELDSISAEECSARRFRVDSARLGRPDSRRPCLTLSGARLGFFNGRNSTLQGSLNATAVDVQTDFDLTGAKLSAPGDYALALGRSRIGGAFYLRSSDDGTPLEVEGLVSLRGSEIRNRIIFGDLKFLSGAMPDREVCPHPVAVDLRGVQAKSVTEIDRVEFGDTMLLLEGARIRELSMDRSAFPKAGLMTLDEAEYEALELTGRSKPDGPRVKKTGELAKPWLKAAVGKAIKKSFSAQPFEQLSRTLRSSGFGREADNIAIFKRDRRAECAVDGPASSALSSLMGLVSRYGYSSGHATVSTLIVATIGTVGLVLALMSPHVLFLPVEVELAEQAPATAYWLGLPDRWLAGLPSAVQEQAAWLRGWSFHQTPHGCPALVAPVYALDLIVPLLDLGQESACRMETRGLVGGWIQTGRVAYQIVGAIMTAILITTLTGILRRD